VWKELSRPFSVVLVHIYLKFTRTKEIHLDEIEKTFASSITINVHSV